MSLVTVTPFARLATQPGAGFVGMGEEPPLSDALTITAAGTAAHADLPAGTNFFRLNTVGAVHVAIGVGAVATQTHRRVSAGHTEPFAVPLGVSGTVRVSVILAAA